MPKTVFVLLSFVVLISLSGFIVPHSSIYNFFLPSTFTSEMILLLTIGLAILVGLAQVTKDIFASLTDIIGSGLMAIAILGFITPTYFGYFYNFVPQADLLTILVLGVSYSLVGLAIPHRNIVAQMSDLRHVVTLINIRELNPELKLWMVNHTPILFHS